MTQDEQQFKAVHGKSSPQEELHRKWEQLRPKIRQRWPQLTNDDLKMIGGDARKLTALVHQRTGAELSDIDKELEMMSDSLENAPSSEEETGTSPKAKGEAEGQQSETGKSASSAETSSSTVNQMGHAVADGYRQVQQQLSAAPVTSSSIAFVAGAVLGYCLASVYNDMEAERRRQEHWYRRYW